MDKESITKLVNSYLNQAINGSTIENNKFEFKRQWPDLKKEKGINEFLKDVTGIVNSFGPEGYIVYGFDDKSKEYYNSVFNDCQLSDPANLYGLINKRVDQLFDIDVFDIVIENHKLSVVYIPPSINKPHVIKNYQTFNKEKNIQYPNQIFVRKTTATIPASKYDLDLMYWDRKNIVPEFEIKFSCLWDTMRFNGNPNSIITLSATVCIENIGRRPISITSFDLIISDLNDPEYGTNIQFNSTYSFTTNPMVINPNNIYSGPIKLHTDINYKNTAQVIRDFNNNIKRLYYSPVIIKTLNSKVINQKIDFI